uniref:Uncharacterized protein n=1 Tax=Rhizophora mucronata TaxID=61149 RepID=A0A2P2KP05_RHIMU
MQILCFYHCSHPQEIKQSLSCILKCSKYHPYSHQWAIVEVEGRKHSSNRLIPNSKHQTYLIQGNEINRIAQITAQVMFKNYAYFQPG